MKYTCPNFEINVLPAQRRAIMTPIRHRTGPQVDVRGDNYYTLAAWLAMNDPIDTSEQLTYLDLLYDRSFASWIKRAKLLRQHVAKISRRTR